MNWQAISFDWNQIRAFLAAAEEGSLSAAARALRTTQPTLGRQVSGLEEALGVTLFERGGRGLMLTEAGQDLLGHVRAMGDAAHRISMVATGQSQDVEGDVSITCVDMIAPFCVLPILEKLREDAPRINVSLKISDSLEDLTRRDADIAIRHVRPDQPDLVAKKAATLHANFYGARSLIDQMGHAKDEQDFRRFRLAGPDQIDQFMEISTMMGVSLAREQFSFGCNSGLVVCDMVRRGMGINILPEEIAEAMPGLVKVMPTLKSFEFPAWLTTHRELQTSRKIRVVYDALADGLSDVRALCARSVLR